MKLLLLGANGQVGWDIAQQASLYDIELIALDRKSLDISKEKDIHRAIEDVAPDVVVNAAAYTAVDQAEKESDVAFSINRDAVKYIAQACEKNKSPLIHISTDYVFDGKKQQPYMENDPVNPLNVYGLSKWEGEEAIRQNLEYHIILRTSWVYGRHGSNFVKTMLRLSKERDTLRIVNDQLGCPTGSFDIARLILQTSKKISNPEQNKICGTYHFCGEKIVSWFDFAYEIFRRCGRESSVSLVPITTDEMSFLAVRPLYSCLDNAKIDSAFSVERRNWVEDIDSIIHDSDPV